MQLQARYCIYYCNICLTEGTVFVPGGKRKVNLTERYCATPYYNIHHTALLYYTTQYYTLLNHTILAYAMLSYTIL